MPWRSNCGRGPRGGTRRRTAADPIVFEDEHLLVIDRARRSRRPSRRRIQPARSSMRCCTTCRRLLVGGADRPGIVHRLDKDTSGLLVVAKTSRVHRALVELMRRARCGGSIGPGMGGAPSESGEIDAPWARPRQRKRMAVVAARQGRRSRAAVARAFRTVTLLELRLERAAASDPGDWPTSGCRSWETHLRRGPKKAVERGPPPA